MKKEGGYKYQRWRNSDNIPFEKILLGYDEINEKTDIVYIVEGATDKFNVDKELKLYEKDNKKCVCSFGKKLSLYQIKKLQLKGVKNIILLYDPDGVEESKNYGKLLHNYFEIVQIGFLIDKDPGEMLEEDFQKVFQNLKDYFTFTLSHVQDGLIKNKLLEKRNIKQKDSLTGKIKWKI